MTALDVPRPLWTADAVATATGGRAVGRPWQAGGVSIDSRSLKPGELFVALKGPTFDGHDFAAAALRAGAAAALVARRPDGLPADAPLAVVDDTFEGLQALGRFARLHCAAPIVGVTGSVGKTGTKEALIRCLAAQGKTFGTTGSLNNHWGVPLSLARLPHDVDYGVFELGMNHAGEIAALTRQVRPDVAVITTVEAVHLEHFASIEGIADAKAEIFEGMMPNGTAILNADNAHIARLTAHAERQGLTRIWRFGAAPDADARLIDCSLHATCSAVTAVIKRERLQFCIALPGKHWVMNSLAVLLAVHAAGADMATAARALATLQPVKGRGTRQRISLRQGSFTLIDESYNASPVAMAAAFSVLGKLDPGAGGRRIAVLGDMLELGADADAFHAGLWEPLRAAEVDQVFCCGPRMRALFERVPHDRRGGYADDSRALAPAVAASVQGGDVVMVKGSLGSRMARVVQALLALDEAGGAGGAGGSGVVPLRARAAG